MWHRLIKWEDRIHSDVAERAVNKDSFVGATRTVVVNNIKHSTMGDVPAALLRPFDLTALPYTASGPTSAAGIKERRAQLGGQLFFDRLLAFANVDSLALYPSSSPSVFRKLLSGIHEADVDRLKRDCFVYYLARDADAAASTRAGNGNGNMDVDSAESSPAPESGAIAARFARTRCLPKTWRMYMDGYWFLDHGMWEAGIECLRDPAIPDVDFVREIVGALTTQVSPPSKALALVNTFLAPRASAGKLVSEEEKDAALLATASVAGMAAAFVAIRAMPDEAAREVARENVWCWSLGAPRSPVGKGETTAQPRALRELLHLALSDEEDAQLVSLLAHPPRDISAPARSLLHDLVTLRLIHAGKYEETLALDKELAGTDAASAADRQRRREMVREFIDILPAAQRRVLLGDRTVNGEAEGDVDMSDWVQVDKEVGKDQEKAKSRPASAAPPAVPSTPARGISAPTPIRAPTLRNLQQSGTPARPSSPFGGPPRFPASPAIGGPVASGSRSTSPSRGPPSPLRSDRASPEPAASVASTAPPGSTLPSNISVSSPRVSASPFVPPASSSKPAARKPKRVIDDTPRRSARRRADDEDRDTIAAAPSEPPIPEGAVAAPTPAKATRRSRRAVDPPKPASVASTPEPPTPTRRSTRAASRATTAEPDHEDLPIPGSFTPVTATRSASKAALDEPEPAAPEPKRVKGKTATRRTTRAMSEATDDGNTSGPGRRTRRTAASERGSPTPSVASSTASPTRRRTRKAPDTNATPRATRSRKKAA